MANLYTICKELQEFSFEVDDETGELLNAPEWDELNMEYEEKVRNTACLIKNIVSDIASFKAEEEALAKRRKRAEKRVEYLERLLLDNMGGAKFSATECEVSFRKSEAVQVENADLLPETFLRIKGEVEPNKTAIKVALKSGQTVAGCKLVENISVLIK